MATIPRTYLTTSKHGLSSVPLRNGQVISIWDSDEVYYDVPKNGASDGAPVRRKISGVRVISTLPEDPMTDIAYIYLGSGETLPDGTPLYEIRIWAYNGTDYEWYIVGNNRGDSNVKTEVSDGKFYIVGTDEIANGDIGPLLKNASVFIQNGIIHGDLDGTASEATHTANADTANIAIYDNATPSQAITSYLHDVSSDATVDLGATLTFTLGDGTTKAVRVSNTTYDVFTEDPSVPGLVNGINTVALSDDTGLLLTGSGWVDIDDIELPSASHATSADNDGLNQQIDTTYIASLAFDNTTRELTPTYGNDTDGAAIVIPDTTYQVFDLSNDGLVPAATDGTKYLRGDGTWQTVLTPDASNVYPGLDPTTPTVGLVPAADPSQGELTKYLRGDGVWDDSFANVFAVNTNGLVPGPASADPTLSLKADGTWTACPDTLNTVGATDNTANSLFVVGSQTQSTSAQSYTNQYVFINSGKLYQSDGASTPSAVQVVDVSSTQALTNKTYNGYTLGTACEATVSSSVALDSTLPTGNAVTTYVNGRISTVQTDMATKLSNAVVAPDYDDTSTSYAAGDYCMYDDGNGALLYKCLNPISAPAGDFDPTDWQSKTLIDVILGN